MNNERDKCAHTTVMKDLCAVCGLDLRKTDFKPTALVSMIHSVPELKVTYEQAQQLGKADEEKLLSSRKLVLLVDLDQTLIHTTNQPSDQIKSKDVISFRLYGANSQLYYTKLRPFTQKFLESVSKIYELHICTFGARMYAHKIAELLDPEKKLFSHRILSRDECFDPQLKTGNLKALFPCGDSMVCIIDDREDVWNYQPNLISVKPYTFFKNIGDINTPNKQKDDLLAKTAKLLSNKNESIDLQNEDEKNEEKDEDNSKKSEKNEIKSIANEEKEQIKKNENLKEPEKKNEELKDHKLKEKDNSIEEGELKEESKLIETAKSECQIKNENVQIEENDDDDDYLLYLLEILKRIHRKFYKEYDEIKKYSAEGEHIKIPDLKNLIPSIRREVLKGVNIVFTGLVPNKIVPEKSKFWSFAQKLGANVTRDLIKDGSPLEKTTHIIAANLNTAKVQEASKLKNIHIVNPIWLYTCGQRWERIDERLYRLTKDDDFRNPDKLKNKLSFDEQLFLNQDLVKFSSKKSRDHHDLIKSNDSSKNIVSDIKLNPYPVYDQITGKLIRPTDQPTTSKQEVEETNQNDIKNDEIENLTPQMVEVLPLSENELKMMYQEVDDACSEEDEDLFDNQDEEEEQSYNYDDLDEENTRFDYGDEPISKKFKKDIECLSESSSEDTNLSDSNSNSNLENLEELGAQLEKDFLS